MAAEGEMAPDFGLATDTGQRISLSKLAGAPAVVYFYPKDDTSGCTKEAQAFTGLAAQFEAAGVPVIAISPDSVVSHAKFRAKYGLGITLGSDEQRAAIEAYGVWVQKSMYGRTYMGVERATFLIGADGRIAKVWRRVKVPGHAEAVLEAARALAHT